MGNIVFIAFVIFGIVFFVVSLNEDAKKFERAPKINYNVAIDLYVNTVSFERNGLYIDDIEYNAYGISGYSRVHSYNSKSVMTLDELQPQYHIYKKANNDTLHIEKGDVKYYLLANQENNGSK